MSLPAWANPPVVGAMNPIRNSSANAGAFEDAPNTSAPPKHVSANFHGLARFMFASSGWIDPPIVLDALVRIGFVASPLPQRYHRKLLPRSLRVVRAQINPDGQWPMLTSPLAIAPTRGRSRQTRA
jgi:hypothetical protein